MNTYTFILDSTPYITQPKIQFTVKDNFLEFCPNPTQYSIYDLMTKYKMNQYLHNTEGPAIIRFRDNHEEYWLEGGPCGDKENWELSRHSIPTNPCLSFEYEGKLTFIWKEFECCVDADFMNICLTPEDYSISYLFSECNLGEYLYSMKKIKKEETK